MEQFEIELEIALHCVCRTHPTCWHPRSQARIATLISSCCWCARRGHVPGSSRRDQSSRCPALAATPATSCPASLQLPSPTGQGLLLGVQPELQAAGMPRGQGTDRSVQNDRADSGKADGLHCPPSLLLFHSTQHQKLDKAMPGPTPPFLLQVVSCTKEATILYQHLFLLTHSTTWQLVGSSLRLERMGRSALANEMAKLLQSSDQ